MSSRQIGQPLVITIERTMQTVDDLIMGLKVSENQYMGFVESLLQLTVPLSLN